MIPAPPAPGNHSSLGNVGWHAHVRVGMSVATSPGHAHADVGMPPRSLPN